MREDSGAFLGRLRVGNPPEPPESAPQATDSGSLKELAELLRNNAPAVALTGAGISTDSGIPDYRGPNGKLRARQPMHYREFTSSAEARRRYWARSAVGWPLVTEAGPNAGHAALARLQKGGIVSGIITQNVDKLHTLAGSGNTVELHGSLAQVVCLECSARQAREELQREIMEHNPHLREAMADHAPDGDVTLPEELVAGFTAPVCPRCGGPLKPDVVFFGESVPAARVERAFRILRDARSLLVLGSSLAVFSGYRFAREAARCRMPIAIVTDGPTRADDLTDCKLCARLGPTLEQLAALLKAPLPTIVAAGKER